MPYLSLARSTCFLSSMLAAPTATRSTSAARVRAHTDEVIPCQA